MTEKQLVVDNLLLNYYVQQNPSEAVTAVVFLHGWRSNGRLWNPVFQLLSQSKFDLYALDLPGFGKSEPPPGDWTVKDYAELLQAFLTKLALNSVCLVGHSAGGKIAIQFAVQYPDRVAKLILVNSTGIRRASPKRSFIVSIAKVLKPAFALPFLRSLRPRLYYTLGAEDYLATPRLQGTFLNVLNADLTGSLRDIRAKTLIIWGDADRETPLRIGTELHRRIANSELKVFSSAGHFTFLDKPREFTKTLSDFLNEPG